MSLFAIAAEPIRTLNHANYKIIAPYNEDRAIIAAPFLIIWRDCCRSGHYSPTATEGNFARLGVRPSEFAAWQVAWENKELTFPTLIHDMTVHGTLWCSGVSAGTSENDALSAKRPFMITHYKKAPP
jgi:hypothetical protein